MTPLRAAIEAVNAPVMGAAEATLYLGVSRQRMHQLRFKHPQFPKPIAILTTGPVWNTTDIVAFAQIERPTGRPPKERETTEADGSEGLRP